MSRLILDKKKIIDNIDIVLVKPQIPENIGLVARVLKNTSFCNLSLVEPNVTSKSFEVAKRAEDVLRKAKYFKDVREAIKDTYFVFGTTRRKREFKFIYHLYHILPQIVSLASKRRISILFGKENFGLSKDEIELCDTIFYLPANPYFSSYNLSMSVGIVCFTIFTFVDSLYSLSHLNLAKKKDIQAMLEFIRRNLAERKIKENILDSVMFSLERLFRRTHLTKKEVEILKIIFKNTKKENRHEGIYSN